MAACPTAPAHRSHPLPLRKETPNYNINTRANALYTPAAPVWRGGTHLQHARAGAPRAHRARGSACRPGGRRPPRRTRAGSAGYAGLQDVDVDLEKEQNPDQQTRVNKHALAVVQAQAEVSICGAPWPWCGGAGGYRNSFRRWGGSTPRARGHGRASQRIRPHRQSLSLKSRGGGSSRSGTGAGQLGRRGQSHGCVSHACGRRTRCPRTRRHLPLPSRRRAPGRPSPKVRPPLFQSVGSCCSHPLCHGQRWHEHSPPNTAQHEPQCAWYDTPHRALSFGNLWTA